MKRRSRRRWVGSDAGQATLEYTGSLVTVSVVVALVLAVVVAPGTRQQIASVVQTAVCRVGGGQECGQPAGAVGGGGSSGSAAGEATGGEQDSDRNTGRDVGQGAGSGVSPDGTVPGGGSADRACGGLVGCAWGGVQQVGSGVYHLGKGAVDDVVGLVEVVRHPGQLVEAGKYIWDHPVEAAKGLVWDQESSDLADRGDYGGAAGRTLWNVGSSFIPGVGFARVASKGGKLGKLGTVADTAAGLSKAGRLADEAGVLARAAERAAARGDVKGAQEAAAAARKKADEVQADARSRGCPIAAGLIPRQRSESGVGLVLATGGGRLGATSVAVTLRPRAAGDECGVPTEAAKKADEEADAAEKSAQPVPGVPSGWGSRVADNGKGTVWQRPGAAGNADQVRIMQPTTQYSNGYVRFYNKNGQPLDLNGKPGPNSTTHVSINPDGSYPTPIGWPQ